jgi:hypothetical protein
MFDDQLCGGGSKKAHGKFWAILIQTLRKTQYLPSVGPLLPKGPQKALVPGLKISTTTRLLLSGSRRHSLANFGPKYQPGGPGWMVRSRTGFDDRLGGGGGVWVQTPPLKGRGYHLDMSDGPVIKAWSRGPQKIADTFQLRMH